MAVTTAAVIGIAAGGAQAVQGFMNASKQKQAARKANQAAEKAMKEARRRAEVDEYAGLDVPLDAFEAQNEANLAADKQAIEALQEGDARALAAGVGRVGAQQSAEAEQTRMAMADEMFNLDKMKADSREAIKQQQISMDVGEAKMQDQRAREAEQARAAAIQSGFQGISKAATAAADLAPLYGKSANDRRAQKMMDSPEFKAQMQAKFPGESDAQLFDRVSGTEISRRNFRQGRRSNYSDYDFSIFDQ
tara:strand:- start:2655 stop:3401 length:747 start_codon:yes stop_codon:yes gene_type:complete